jgi:hypothetical protein
MNYFDSSPRGHTSSFRCTPFAFFVLIFIGLVLLTISPVTAAPDTPAVSDLRTAWVKSFEQDIGEGTLSIIGTRDGGSLASGIIRSPSGNSRLSVIKTDANGNTLWDWTEEGNTYDGYSLVETADRGYVIVTTSNSTITNGIFLTKLDLNGKTTWTQQFKKGRYYYGTTIETTRDGGFIIDGSVMRNDTSPSAFWEGYTLRLDTEGKERWTGFFKGQQNFFDRFISQTEDGGYIIAGTTESYGSNGVPSVYLLKLNDFGNKEWFATYESGAGNEKPTVIQTPDGGYILMDISLPVTPHQEYRDLFLIRTDDRGKELWRKKFSGLAKTPGNLLIQTPGGISIIAGSYEGSEGKKTGAITIIDVDLNGSEMRNRTFSTGQSIDIQDIAVVPGEGYLVTGMVTAQGVPNNGFAIIRVLDPMPLNEIPAKKSYDLTVVTKDAKTGTFMGGARVYLDGESIGSTSDPEGKLAVRDIGRGSHTLRVAKTDYEEITRPVTITENEQVSFILNRSHVLPVQIHGSTEDTIDIIFVASNTSYDCTAKTKIPDDEYVRDEQKFVTDLNSTIDTIYLKLDTYTSGFVGLPDNYRQRFNFYYYWDSDNFADAFDGCAGKLPDTFWDDAPFADVAVIMYPSYKGHYTGSPCEPIGCANGLGPGSGSWLKAPADSPMIFLHENGHVLFGLIDTYCGDTFYVENSPFPNVWDTEEACIKDAETKHWTTSLCRQILKPAGSRLKNPCVKNFWREDPDPDIMGSGAYSGTFGNASTSRIRYIFETINRWQK